MSETNAEQDRIEENLRKTRSRMDARLSELQDRLQPGQLVGDFMDYIRGNGGQEFSENLLASVQRNPLPAVVAGVGLAWLMASNFRPPPPPARDEYGYTKLPPPPTPDWHGRMAAAEAGVSRDDTETDAAFSDRLEAARGQVLGVSRHAQETASAYTARVQGALSAAMQGAAQAAHDLRDRAAGAASSAAGAASSLGHSAASAGAAAGSAAAGAAGSLAGTAQQFGSQIASGAASATGEAAATLAKVAENPVVLGAVGFATGALLALLVPQTDKETELLGDSAAQARHTLRDAAQSAVDQGAKAAGNVVQAAQDSAAAHGFSPDKSLNEVVEGLKSGEIVENAKQVSQDVLKAGQDSLKT